MPPSKSVAVWRRISKPNKLLAWAITAIGAVLWASEKIDSWMALLEKAKAARNPIVSALSYIASSPQGMAGLIIFGFLWLIVAALIGESGEKRNHALPVLPNCKTEPQVWDQWNKYYCAGRELYNRLRRHESKARIEAFKLDAKRWMDDTRDFAAIHLSEEKYRLFLASWPALSDMTNFSIAFHEKALQDINAAVLVENVFARSKEIARLANLVE